MSHLARAHILTCREQTPNLYWFVWAGVAHLEGVRPAPNPPHKESEKAAPADASGAGQVNQT